MELIISKEKEKKMKTIYTKGKLVGFYNPLDKIWVFDETSLNKRFKRIQEKALLLKEEDFYNYVEKFVNQVF